MRISLDLNGTWDFLPDLDPKYHTIHGGFHRPGINRRHWQKVPVPGVWQKYGERYDIFEGVCWLSREFEVGEIVTTAAARLRFGGVNYLCEVYLNGEHVGGHEGGYTEFILDVTGKVKPGLNHLAVQVDNRATTIKWPPCLGYFNYGGIHRSVSLEIMDAPWLEEMRVTAWPEGAGGKLRLRAKIGSASGGLTILVQINGCEKKAVVGADGTADCEIACADVAPWSPDKPVLYPLSVRLYGAAAEPLDEWHGQCGFRSIAMQNGRILLNGADFTPKGICYVYDSPTHGLTMLPESLAADLNLMKELGCNAVRCHYPMDNAFYELCDALGLLVWIEPPTYCYHPKDNEHNTRFADPEWLALAQQMAREMIAVAHNHPSVAIYSIGNECNTNNPEAGDFFRALARTIRAEDDSRLLSYAALYGIVGPIAEIVDVVGINSYWGWYDKVFGGKGLSPEAERAERESGMVKPEPIDLQAMRKMLGEVLGRHKKIALLLTEFGADSIPGFHSRSRDLWSEEYHRDLLEAVFALAREFPQIIGTFPFVFSDYRDPSKVHNGYWNEINLKGVIDYRRRRKKACEAIRKAYSG